MTPELHSTQKANEPSTTSVPAPRNRWALLAFTFVPFFVYQLAQRIPLPTIGTVDIMGPWSWSETISLVAVGIMPWIIAAAMVEIVAVVVPRWRQLRHGGRAKLQRATTLLGLVIAALEAYGIAYLLTYEPTIALTPPSWEFYVPYSISFIPSSIRIFAALLAGAVFVRLLAEVVTRRGLTHGYVVFVAGDLVVSTLRGIVPR